MSYRIVIEPQGKHNFKWWIEEDLRSMYSGFAIWVPVVYMRHPLLAYSSSEKRAEKAARKELANHKLRLERERQVQKQANINKAQRRYISV